MNVFKPKAVILLSGGLDSATVLAMAQADGYECYALSFDYGQRHRAELNAAVNIAQSLNVKNHKIFKLDIGQFGGSALTDSTLAVPETLQAGIPITYVPARNTVFLSIALAWAETLGANDLFIGVNAVDYSGYPDCRPVFIDAFATMANLATKAAVEGNLLKIHTPLLHLSKAQIINKGTLLGLDYTKTVSCYKANAQGYACGKCDSCKLRKKGFIDANQNDKTNYY